MVCGGCVGGLLAAGWGDGEDERQHRGDDDRRGGHRAGEDDRRAPRDGDEAPSLGTPMGGDELLLEDVEEVGHGCSWLLIRARSAASPRDTRWRAAGSEIDCAAAISS